MTYYWFEFNNGSNPYIAFNKDKMKQMLRNHKSEVKTIRFEVIYGIYGYYEGDRQRWLMRYSNGAVVNGKSYKTRKAFFENVDKIKGSVKK